MLSGNDDDGVIGYQATTVAPANMQPKAAAAVSVNNDFAGGLVHALDEIWIALGEVGGGVIVSGFHGREIQVGGFHLFGKLLADRFIDFCDVDLKQLGHHAHVDHVLDQLAQLGLGTDRSDQLVVRNSVEDEIGTQSVEVQGLVVHHDCARRHGHYVLVRGLRIHGDYEINFLLARDVAVFVGANRIPGGEAGNVRGEQVFA